MVIDLHGEIDARADAAINAAYAEAVTSEPEAVLLNFGDDALQFELRCFVEFGMGLQIRDELHAAIDREFNERGIAFAIPKLNLQLDRRGGSGGSGRKGT